MKKAVFIVLAAICVMLTVVTPASAEENITFDNEGVYEFVSRMYTVILERQSDENGLSGWYHQLVSKTETGADIVRGFLFSEEFTSKGLSDVEYLHILYRALFDREADSVGQEQWLAQLNAGVSRLTICKGFVDSPEFKSLCERYGIISGTIMTNENGQQIYLVDQFVERLYVTTLGRQSYSQGKQAWKSVLLNAHSTGAEIVQGFIFSDECKQMGLSDEAFIDLLYKALFDRDGDSVGKAEWMNLLQHNMTRQYVCCGFINSEEFNKLCLKYGIEKGQAYSTDIKDQNEKLTFWISDLYLYVLGRGCSTAEIENALSILMNRNVSGNNFISSIFLSDEYERKGKSHVEFLNDLYEFALNKSTDSSDYSQLLQRLESGSSRADILQECFRMPEFLKRCQELKILCEGVLIDIPLMNEVTVFNSWKQLSDTSWNNIQLSINEFSKRNYDVGFVMVDLNTGQGICYNSNKIFYSASTIKGPYVVFLNEKIPSSVHNWGQTMRSTIMISSNEGYQSLRRAFGSSQFSEWLNEAGCSGVNASLNYPQYTSADLAKMWIKCYSFFSSGKENASWCAQLFTSTLQSGILNTLGKQYTTYSKAGWIGEGGYLTVQNDAGIIMKPGHPYVLAIMSNAYGRVDLLEGLVCSLDGAHSEMTVS